jgi:uncharacterized protein
VPLDDQQPAADASPATPPPAGPGDAPRRLPPAIVGVWRIAALVRAAVLAAAAGAALLVLGWSAYWVLPVLAAGLAAAFLVPRLRYRHWSYRVGPADVRVRHGWLWRRTSVVLHARIQHVDTRQGPLERAYGLATVAIFTAGVVGARLDIPGLAEADAAALRDLLVDLSGAGDAV